LAGGTPAPRRDIGVPYAVTARVRKLNEGIYFDRGASGIICAVHPTTEWVNVMRTRQIFDRSEKSFQGRLEEQKKAAAK